MSCEVIYSSTMSQPLARSNALAQPRHSAGRSLASIHGENCWQTYGELLTEGIGAEIARYVLPNACETQIICTWNFREIRHIMKLRTSKRALPEFRAVAEEIRKIAKEIAPQVFADL
jgi:flavin-dependent thymidylate synthase